MGTPRIRRRDMTRQKILDEARKIILTEGLNSLSMRLLAERIDYSPSAIYKYFDSKQEILRAIREEGFALGLALQAERVPADATPPEKYYLSGKAFLEFAERYPEHYQLMFNSPDEPQGAPDELARARFGGLLKMLEEGVESGYFKLPEGYTPLLMVFHSWFVIHGAVMLQRTAMKAYRKEFSALCDTMLRVFIDSVTAKRDT
jgi:AcrR family transcriptional regulator